MHTYSVKQNLNLSRFGGWNRVEVPCCKGCGRRLTLGRLIRGARLVALCALVGIPAAWLLHKYTTLSEVALGWSVFGIILIVIIAHSFYQMFHPPRFAVDLTGSNVTFEFADRQQAEAFAAANGLTFTNAQ